MIPIISVLFQFVVYPDLIGPAGFASAQHRQPVHFFMENKSMAHYLRTQEAI